MPMRFTATLDGTDLPHQFSYEPYIPRKRKSVTATAKAVVTQSSDPVIVHGDGTIPWSIEAAFPSEFQWLYDLYDETTLTLYTFEGYWGETFEVYFDQLDKPKVRGRLFNVSGQFQVFAVTTPQAASCGGVL